MGHDARLRRIEWVRRRHPDRVIDILTVEAAARQARGGLRIIHRSRCAAITYVKRDLVNARSEFRERIKSGSGKNTLSIA
jgi:hypothetical protein